MVNKIKIKIKIKYLLYITNLKILILFIRNFLVSILKRIINKTQTFLITNKIIHGQGIFTKFEISDLRLQLLLSPVPTFLLLQPSLTPTPSPLLMNFCTCSTSQYQDKLLLFLKKQFFYSQLILQFM